MFSFHSFPCDCPVFPAPLTEGSVLSPLYILASFVIDELAVGTWVEFWGFFFVFFLSFVVVVVVVAISWAAPAAYGGSQARS